MSVQLMSLVFRTDLPAKLKLPLLSLADQASDVGVCWPKLDTTAFRCSIKVRHLRDCIRELEELGLVGVERRGKRLTNRYVVNVDELTSLVSDLEGDRQSSAAHPESDRHHSAAHPKGPTEEASNPLVATVSDERDDTSTVGGSPVPGTGGDRHHSAGGDRQSSAEVIGTPVPVLREPSLNHQQNHQNHLADKPPSGQEVTGTTVPPTQERPRKPVWDFMVTEMRLPDVTRRQQIRLGSYDREISAALTAEGIPIEAWYTELGRRCLAWPEHFPDATLTADALVKHIGPLGRAPLRGDPEQMRRAAIRADSDATAFETRPALPQTGDPS